MHAARFRAAWFAASAVLATILVPTLTHAAAQPVDMVNGIGLIDYSRKPDFEIGSWVKYRILGSSELGMEDDYTVTIMIAGEERFWGDDCFWVETWTEAKNQPPVTVATLMSYKIFGDSLPIPHLQLFTRKMITTLDEQGKAVEVVTKRNAGSMRGRSPIVDKIAWHIDSLGSETITVGGTSYDCKKILFKQAIGSTTDQGDSTIRTEVQEDRVVFSSPKVPITGIVREEISNLIRRKVWKIGKSQDAPMRVMEHAKGAAEYVESGVGLTPQFVPEKYRKRLEDYAPARTTPPRPRAAKKRTS